VAAWVRDMRSWIDSLYLTTDDIQEVWDTFVQEFNDHFSDSQLQQRARLELDKCKMCFPDVDQYILDVKLPRAWRARLERRFVVAKFRVLHKAFPVKTAVKPREPECIQWSPLQRYVVMTTKGLCPR
jgi:hypothetical protein